MIIVKGMNLPAKEQNWSATSSKSKRGTGRLPPFHFGRSNSRSSRHRSREQWSCCGCKWERGMVELEKVGITQSRWKSSTTICSSGGSTGRKSWPSNRPLWTWDSNGSGYGHLDKKSTGRANKQEEGDSENPVIVVDTLTPDAAENCVDFWARSHEHWGAEEQSRENWSVPELHRRNGFGDFNRLLARFQHRIIWFDFPCDSSENHQRQSEEEVDSNHENDCGELEGDRQSGNPPNVVHQEPTHEDRNREHQGSCDNVGAPMLPSEVLVQSGTCVPGNTRSEGIKSDQKGIAEPFFSIENPRGSQNAS